MKVIDSLNNAKSPLFSFELLPPIKGKSITELYDAIDPLMEFNPANINITYHQSEVVYERMENGYLQKKIIRKRPGTVAISAAINHKYNIPVVTHIICGGFSKDETEDALIDLNFLGLDNILALRGDPSKGQRRFIAEENGHANSVELVQQIMDMNEGKFLDKNLQKTFKSDFCVGVAGYPEKHFESPNMETDMQFLKEKVDAGAEYIVTQMFFDNSKFFSFVDKCRKMGITVPIIPGLKPITYLNDLKLLPQVFHIDIPNDLVKELNKCKNNNEARQVGVEWTVMQSKELIAKGAPAVHYYTIGISENIRQIAKQVF